MTETFKLKCTFTVEHTVYAENLVEAKGIVKGMAVVQLPGFKLERIDPMKLDVKIAKKAP
jgi:hypothetical protein